jgi:tetratricopeptide (TPR) repeat protein
MGTESESRGRPSGILFRGELDTLRIAIQTVNLYPQADLPLNQAFFPHHSRRGTPDSPKQMIGASIPRSGHSFLHNLITKYFGEELFYCEFYTPPWCCKTIPCTRRGTHTLTFQKNHDRDFALRTDLHDALYVVQYRHPVPEVLSDYELELRDTLQRPVLKYRQSEQHYVAWLAHKAIYYRRFHEKWFRSRFPNAAYLNYDDFAADPAAALRPIIDWAAGNVDEERLARVIEQEGSTRAGGLPTSSKVFTPRRVEESRYFKPALLGPFEAYILDRCPQFGFQPMLEGTYQNSVLHGLILLNDSQEPLPRGFRDRLSAAAELAAEHPDVQIRLAQREMNKGEFDSAVGRLEKLIEQHPFYAPGYRVLFTACRKGERPVPESILGANALLGCLANADLLTELGAAFQSKGLVVYAVAALSMAVVLAPDNRRAHHILAAVLSSERRWSQARVYAERATILAPENDASARLLAEITKRLA